MSARVAGYKVLLYDVSAERIEAGLATDQRQPGPPGLLRQDRPRTTARRRSALIKPARPTSTTSPQADLVIEAATEDETVKRKIYGQRLPGR